MYACILFHLGYANIWMNEGFYPQKLECSVKADVRIWCVRYRRRARRRNDVLFQLILSSLQNNITMRIIKKKIGYYILNLARSMRTHTPNSAKVSDLEQRNAYVDSPMT